MPAPPVCTSVCTLHAVYAMCAMLKCAMRAGHFREEGYNGLEMANVANCWANDLLFINSDIAFMAVNTHFCTFSNIRVTATAARVAQYAGHHAITVAKSATDTLVTSFLIAQPYYHDLAVVGHGLTTQRCTAC
jgi:hypothetical protein